MKDTKFRILLDIHEVRSQATIPVKVGDVSCKIYITLVEGGKPYKIHENSFGVFTGKKGDNNPILNNCIIENGIIRYDFTPQTVAAAGVLECEIRIYDEDGGVLTTPSFNIVVDERAVNDSELASTSEFTFLDEIIVSEGQRIENERNRIEAFNNLGIDLEDDGEVISIVKTDIDGSQEKASFLKYADVIPPVTATASGSAITIESSQAPLQNLKLYGKTTQDGTPTPDNPIELKSVGDSGSYEVRVYGKNLLNNTATTQTVDGVTITVNANKSVTYKGTATKTFNSPLSSSFYIPKGKYKMLGGTWNIELIIPNQSAKYYTSQTFEVTEDGCRIYPYKSFNNGTVYDSTIYPMLVLESVTDETYEPYNKQSITFTDNLRGIGDIADEIDFARGVTTQRFNVVDLSTLTWNYGTYWRSLNLREVIDIDTISPKFLATNYKVQSWYAERNGAVMCIDDYGGICVFNTDAQTTPTGTLIYKLKTPIETPLTETELNAYRQLMTRSGTTTILSEADMTLDYYTPKGQALGNIHSQVNKDYLKLQQAIITTGGSTL